VDGLIGGIPCQPHSLAGKRLGEDDERDLWSDARRIIVQSGAWFVLIENVRGMLSSGGAERVWRDLHRLGFTVEVGLFTATEVGASHERERLFILAVADREDGGYQYSRGDKTKPVPTLTGQALGASFHQVQPTYTVGGIPSKERRSLNPLFVEWLMGWPPGWTLLAWTDFACSATELSAFKARMRSALLHLGLPPPAPFVQPDLFG
jgi:site-specific DNA-cytosine methylase